MHEKIRRDSIDFQDLPEPVPPKETNIIVENDEKPLPTLNENNIQNSENTTLESDESMNKPYEQYIKEAENNEDFFDVIKHLVNVIKRKDSQIDSLLSSQGDKKEKIPEEENT